MFVLERVYYTETTVDKWWEHFMYKTDDIIIKLNAYKFQHVVGRTPLFWISCVIL